MASVTLRAAAAAVLVALAGCAAQPIGTFDPATVTRLGGEVQRDLYFRPGSASLLPGQAEEMNGLLRSLVLRPQDDVILTFGSSGSDRLNALRAAELRRVVAPGPARLRVVGPLGFAQAPDRPDVVLLQVRRYDRALVSCPGSGRTNEDPALLADIPLLGCANAANGANQAAELRDLTAPRSLDGSDAIPSIRAVDRYRRGEVTIAPLDSMN
jgi:type IV pilus biogenesis protein CpaD/CtpE